MIDKLTPTVFKTGFLAELLQIDGVVLAGGAIRDAISDTEPKDYDIFFTNIIALDQAIIFIEKHMELSAGTHYTKTYKTDTNQLYDKFITVQIVFKNFYADRQAIINSFDFTNTMFAIDKTGFAIGEKTLGDIVDNKVGINVITKPLSSLNRLVKYVRMGYDVQEAYDYIVSLLVQHNPQIILNASFYDGE